MATDFVTFSAEDPEYKQYLLGSFSKSLRALPVESFSQHSRRERVTFKVVPVSDIQKPAWWKIYFKACRPELLGLTLGPFFVTAMLLQEIVPSFIAATFGLFFLHVSAFLFNDFRDHMRGVDFANRRRGSQVIQKGWASAREVRGWACVNALLALVCGLPALVQSWVLLAIVVVAAFLVLGLSWISARWSRFGVSDIMIFVGLGPLLTSAASLIVVGTVSPHVLLLGTAFGGMAVLTLQVRQLENLFRAGRDSFRTFIGAFDFDQARWVVMGQTVFVGMLQVVIATQVFDRPILWLAFALALIPLYFLYVSVREAASPLSSNLVHIGRRAVFAQAVLLLWWGAAVWI